MVDMAQDKKVGFIKGLVNKLKGGPSVSEELKSARHSMIATDRAKLHQTPTGGFPTIDTNPGLNRWGGVPGTKVPAKTLQQARAERFAKR